MILVVTFISHSSTERCHASRNLQSSNTEWCHASAQIGCELTLPCRFLENNFRSPLSDIRQPRIPLRSFYLVTWSSSSSWTTFYGSIDAPGPGASNGVLKSEIRKGHDQFTNERLRSLTYVT